VRKRPLLEKKAGGLYRQKHRDVHALLGRKKQSQELHVIEFVCTVFEDFLSK
jgi:hypothetical protein